MPAPRFDAAGELVTQLKAADINATRSVAEADALRPCVLVPPPTLGEPVSYAGPTVTWRLVALAASPLGDAASWSELDELLDAVWDVLPCERAEPIAYQLPTGGDPLPAYAITVTTES